MPEIEPTYYDHGIATVGRHRIGRCFGHETKGAPVSKATLGPKPVTLVNRAFVTCLELAAVDCHDRIREQIQLLAQHHESPENIANRVAVVLAEVRYHLEVRGQAPGKPLSPTLRCASLNRFRLHGLRFYTSCAGCGGPDR